MKSSPNTPKHVHPYEEKRADGDQFSITCLQSKVLCTIHAQKYSQLHKPLSGQMAFPAKLGEMNSLEREEQSIDLKGVSALV